MRALAPYRMLLLASALTSSACAEPRPATSFPAAKRQVEACQDADCFLAAGTAAFLSTAPDASLDDALLDFERACDLGSLEACSWAGAVEIPVDGLYGDTAHALALFRKACDGGYGPGCSNLAFHLSTVQRDEAAAQATWARSLSMTERECRLGVAASCESLGVHREKGRGAPRDLPAAARAFEQALATSSVRPWSATRLGQLLRTGGPGLSADPARAAGLLEQACQQGDGTACDALTAWAGITAGPVRGKPAQEWRELACAKGHRQSCMTLAESSPSPERQFAYLKRACDRRSPGGCLETARRLRDGIGTPANPAAADALLAKICAKGVKDACR